MIFVSNITAQTLTAGQSITFNRTEKKTGCAEARRNYTNGVTLTKCGMYSVTVNANIGTVAAGSGQLSVAINSIAVPLSAMNVVTAAAGDLQHVSVTIPIQMCCGDNAVVTVINTGTTDLTVAPNANLFIRRIS